MKFLSKMLMPISMISLTLNAFEEEEAVALKNIRQVTHPSMGFEKAGEAYFSPDGTTIIFQAVPKGETQYQIYSLKKGDSKPKLVSTGKGACSCAYFRPDGKKIIFASSHSDPRLNDPNYELAVPGYQRNGGDYIWEFTPFMNIYEANPDGTELRALTSGEAYHAECAYSNDGKKIVYASNESGSMNVYTMNSDGTGVQQITKTDHCYNGGPFFSPDGKQIAFRADRDKKDYLQIYVINSDGTNEKKITGNDAVNWSPYWHPNGKVLAYTSSIHGHWNYEIYLQNIKTGKEHRLTYHPTFDGLPVFNREGNKIAWTSKRGADNTSQIFIADFEMPKELE